MFSHGLSPERSGLLVLATDKVSHAHVQGISNDRILSKAEESIVQVLLGQVFVFVLLTRISGVPLLERRGLKKWGDDPGYQAYLERTPVLFPRTLRAS